MKNCKKALYFISFVSIFIGISSMSFGPAHSVGNGGTIKGKIEMPAVVAGLNRQRPLRYGSYANAEPSTPATKESTPEVTNIVVYLEGAGLDNIQRETRAAILDQRDATFIPHVLPIVKGTTVKIVNRDKTYHNVFSLSSVKKFNIGRRPTGEEVPVTFDKLGTVQVFCDIHSHMSAFIVVLPNALFTQPKPDGTYSLDDVPPGKYTIQAWHERLSTTQQTVTVGAGEIATVNFTMQ
ncbi:MAG TPA: carboxypeptidase regulatory-like domain-containing protein [Bacteroidota bacterium]